MKHTDDSLNFPLATNGVCDCLMKIEPRMGNTVQHTYKQLVFLARAQTVHTVTSFGLCGDVGKGVHVDPRIGR